MALITMEEIEGLSPMFKGEKGHARAKRVMRMLGIDQLAERYEKIDAKRAEMFGEE